MCQLLTLSNPTFERAAVAVTSALILAPTHASMVAVMVDYSVISRPAR